MGRNHSENIHIKRELSASDTPDEGTQVRVQRKHKDTLFRYLFRDKGKLLQLYNDSRGKRAKAVVLAQKGF